MTTIMSLPTTYPGLTSFQENILERGIKGKTYSTLSQCTFTRELETTKNETNPKRYLSRDDTKRTEDTVLVCMLCNWTGHENLWEHVTTTKHSHRYEQLKSRLLKDIPKESSLQMNSLREFLQTSYYSNCLHDYQYYIREDIIWKFKNLLSIVDSESHCRVVGSHVTRTSLNQSNLNIEVVHTNSQLFMKDPRAKNSIHHKLVNPDAENGMELNYHTMYYDLIPNAFETLHNIMKYLHNPYSEYREIFSVDEYQTFDDLNSTVPKLILNYIPDKIKLEITCYNQSGYKLSQLLKVYLSFDPRARELSSLVRYWASICRIDKPNLGTYPPETFVILVIFYLQRISPPILPCLHEMYSSFSNTGRANGPKTSTKSKLAPNITDEFSRLELCEDQGTSSDGIIDNTDISTDEKNLEDGLDNVDDDIGDEEEEDDAHIDSDSQEIENLKQNWVSLNDKPSYFLFIDFLKYMMEEFDSPYNVITIRTLKKLSLSNKRWHSRIKPIENPIRPLMNISRCIGSLRTFNYIKKCFERGFYYLTSVPLDTKLKPKTNYISEPQDFIKLYYESYRLDQYFSMKWTHGKPPKDVDTISEMIQQDIFARDVNEIDTLFDRTQMSYTDLGLLPRIVSQQYDKKHLIPQDSEAVIFCLSCKMFGHSKKQCPKAEVQKLYDQFKDYDHSLDSEANLDEIFGKMFQRDSISPNLYHYHNQITGQLSTMINSAFKGFNFELRRFGSTVNSLGTYDSDLDICMTLKNNPTGKGVDCIDILKNVCSVLSSVKRVSGLRPVLTARVPILRFKYANFEIDLSMYNRCAIHNSELLKKYSELDHRVKIIVYLVKRLAKVSIQTIIASTNDSKVY